MSLIDFLKQKTDLDILEAEDFIRLRWEGGVVRVTKMLGHSGLQVEQTPEGFSFWESLDFQKLVDAYEAYYK